jgi:hypothetical protein
MSQHDLEICPDCKVALPFHMGETHPYFGASPSCWELYGKVLAREYENPHLMKVHRLTVDAYAAQHPGKPERRSIQSVWVHLASLHLIIERGLSHEFARRVIASLTTHHALLNWLEPPGNLGEITVVQASRAIGLEEHQEAIHRWARSVWAAWQPHHTSVAIVADEAAARL